ncbi:MAG: D-inositol-3-phosphate glycosyltransferase [Gammaproteobacteria bacterium]|nr:D-inositol-3-phosphate glycosyltransferase [Gammaproteobacteria bacterium]
MQRHRVLVLTSTFPRWSNDHVPRFVFDLSKCLAAEFDVVVLAPHARGAKATEMIESMEVRRFRYGPDAWETLAYEGGILSGLARNPVRVMLVPFFMAAAVCSIVHCLRRERIDIIHAHWLVPQGLAAVVARWIARRRVPILCTSHGADLFALRGKFFRRLKTFVIRQCDALTVVSRSMLTAVAELEGGVQTPIYVSPMGADLRGTFTPDRRLERSHAQILFVGRLVAKKGLDVLIDALPKILEQYPDARLRVIGDGPERERYRKLAARQRVAERIDWVGGKPHSELVAEYRRATMLVFPSVKTGSGDQEGLGLVPVEALGCECPVVASDLPAIRDVIADGETGLLAAHGDPASLAEQIIAFLGDPNRRLAIARRGREAAVQRFDWQEVVQRYRLHLKSLIGGKGL